VPKVHDFDDKVADDFFGILGDKADIELFANKSVQNMIDFKYPYVKQWIIIKLFVPFLLFLVVYIIWNNVTEMDYREELMKHKFDSNYDMDKGVVLVNWIFWIMVLLGAVYFLVIEMGQFMGQGLSYMASPWNYIDVLPPLLNIVYFIKVMVDGTLDEYNVANLTIKTVATFFMWAKMLYFLRIFDDFAYLIRMIVRVIYDMRIFMFILLVVIFAFSDAFYGISRENEPGDEFIKDFWEALLFTYLMTLGDWDIPDTLGKKVLPLGHILFIAASIFNLTVMLNLLIAIISETFGEVNNNRDKFSYQEKAGLIAENIYLIPSFIKKGICEKDSFLIIATEVD
jgi:hypothetical protein